MGYSRPLIKERLPAQVQRHIVGYTQPGPWFWDLFLEQLPDTKDAVISGNGNVIMRSKDNVLYEYQQIAVVSGAGTPTKTWRWVPVDAKDFKGDLVRINDDGSVLLANFQEQVGMMLSRIKRRGQSGMQPKYERSTLIYLRTDQEISPPSKISEFLESMSDDASVCITSSTSVELQNTTRFIYTRTGNSWQRSTVFQDLKQKNIIFEKSDPRDTVQTTPDGSHLIIESIFRPYTEILQRSGDKFKSIFFNETLPFEWTWYAGTSTTVSSSNDGNVVIISKNNYLHAYAIVFMKEEDRWNLIHHFKAHELIHYVPPLVSKDGKIVVVPQNGFTSIYKIINKELKLSQKIEHKVQGRYPAEGRPVNMQYMSYDAHIITINDRLYSYENKTQQWQEVKTLPFQPGFPNQSQFVSNNGFVIKTSDEILAIRPQARNLSAEQLNLIENFYAQHQAQPEKTIILGQPFNMLLSEADKEAVQKDLALFTSLPSIIQKIVRARLNVITIHDPGYQRYERRKQLEQFLMQDELEGYKKLKGKENIDFWLASKQSELDLAQTLGWTEPAKIKAEKEAAKKAGTTFIQWIEQAITEQKAAAPTPVRAAQETEPSEVD